MENGHIANETPSFCTQANALLRKNFTYHKRNVKTNVYLVMAPIMLFLLLVSIQRLLDTEFNKGENKCGCICTRKQGDTCLKEECGIQYSDLHQVGNCPIPNPPEWPPLLQLPAPQNRAYRTHFFSSSDFPNASYPVTILFTGTNQSFGEIISGNMIPSTLNINNSNIMASMATNVMGSESAPHYTNFLEPAFFSDLPIYYLQRQCMQNSTFHVPVQISSISKQQDVKLICAPCLRLWHNNSFEVNNELYKGYWQSNPKRQINEIVSGYDFLNSNGSIFNVSIWYNSTYKNDTGFLSPIALARVPRSINMLSNAYLQFLLGAGTKMLFEFVKEMPKPETKNKFDFASLLGALFFTWIILQLFPIALTSLVYEKQQKLRIMMKMHGLGDVPYWMISYGYFLAVSIAYLLCCVIFGSVIGLKFFTMNDYSIQFVFYFIYINLQISLTFLLAPLFSNAKTATVIAYMGVLESGELASVLFQFFVQDTSFPRGWIIVMELYPVLALYRGLYEFSQYAFNGNSLGTDGMRWSDLNDSTNGMKEVLIIMFIEWLLVVFFIYYMNQVLSSRSSKNPLFFLKGFHKNLCPSFRKPGIQRQDSKVFIQIDKPDVNQEREKVKHLLLEREINHAIVCDNMRKVYQERDGNPDKVAVNGLSLALPQGECFGMLGPNGAGKTSFINMMTGLTKPTSGTTFVQGLDIKTHMDVIYTSMGVCPQQDLLWESLTGREHLLFYGRLKNLKGSTLTQAVEESLRSVNLFHRGVADKQAGKYSGGMKRKLSVAISLIGNPRVVYMDEPSTGLDPASRKNLWNVIKRAKQGRAIILTTHSMEEAEVLCDRLGILVDGSLQCIGNPKELKARYGKTYIFTVTTSMDHEKDVENLVQHISPNANKIYNISGTQKFELPKDEIKIANVFEVIENAKRRFTVSAWSLVDTTLEDVFIKVARGAQPSI